MAGQYIPPPELAPPPWPREMPVADRYEAWLGMIATGEKLLMAGILDKVGPDGDWQAEFRRLYELSEDDRLRRRIRRAAELQRRRGADAE